MLQLDLSKLSGFISDDFLSCRRDALSRAHDMLRQGNGPGGEFTGWVGLPANYDKVEFDRIKGAAKKIRADSQVLVVVGILLIRKKPLMQGVQTTLAIILFAGAVVITLVSMPHFHWRELLTTFGTGGFGAAGAADAGEVRIFTGFDIADTKIS